MTDELPKDLSVGLFKLKFQALGTQCSIIFKTEAMEAAEAYRQAALAWVKAFEAKYSRFREDSLISTINQKAGDGDWIDLDEDAETILGMIDTVHFLSRGVLDPTSLPLTYLWKQAAESGEEPSESMLEKALSLVRWSSVERVRGQMRLPVRGMALDLGGYGKEYAVDRVADMAEEFGVRDVLVDFGRDIRALGSPVDAPCWVIGVEDGAKPGEVWERLGLTNRGVASSGNYRRHVIINGKAYGHLIDCRSGWPVRHDCQGATVVSERCLDAGIIASTAFILGPQDGLELIESTFGSEGTLQTSTRKLESRSYHAYLIQEAS
jgi:FAD:protein FMN transferase